MKPATLLLSIVSVVSIAITIPPGQIASAQTRSILKAPTVQQSPHSGQMAPTEPGVATRTHCNGTCMCSGDDCNNKWIEDNCKKDSHTCSGSSGEEKICTCVKKAVQ